MVILKKAALVSLSSLVGVIAGTAFATPAIALMNYLATDGPIFPPPLVALGFLALPVAVLLLIMQVLIVTYEIVANRALGNAWPLLSLAAGSVAGFTLYLALRSSQSGLPFALALIMFAVLQAICVFSCHWVADKRGFGTPAPRRRV